MTIFADKADKCRVSCCLCWHWQCFACQATGTCHLCTSFSLEKESSYWKIIWRWWKLRHSCGLASFICTNLSSRANKPFPSKSDLSPAHRELFTSWSVRLRMTKGKLLSLSTCTMEKRKREKSLLPLTKDLKSATKIKSVVVMASGGNSGQLAGRSCVPAPKRQIAGDI